MLAGGGCWTRGICRTGSWTMSWRLARQRFDPGLNRAAVAAVVVVAVVVVASLRSRLALWKF